MSLSRRHILRASLTAAGVMILPGRSLAADEPGVGDVHDIVNVAYGTPPGEAREELELADAVYFNEVIETDGESALELVFTDESRLTMGENSSLIIDEFIYDPASGDGRSTLTLTRGAFRYVSGLMPKENVAINTPTMTAGIRGTELVFSVDGDGQSEMSVIEGEVECRSRVSGRVLRVLRRQSALIDRAGKWQGGVRDFVHEIRSIAIAEGLGGARRRWRIRKPARRRIIRRQRRKHR